MPREIKIWDGRGAWETIDPRLSRDLCPSIGCTPSITSPLLNRLRSGLYFDQDSFLQIRDKFGCPADEAPGKFIFNTQIPIRAEVKGSLNTQAECAFPFRGMGWIGHGWTEEIEGGFLWNPILIERAIFLLEIAFGKNLIV